MPSEALLRLAGRHALVTGAGSGIGAAIARSLAAAGATVSLVGRREPPLKLVAAEIGARAGAIVTFDLADPVAVAEGIARVAAEAGAIDILVNNAGQAMSAPLLKTDLALWSQMLTVNLTGTFLATQAVLAGMLDRRAGRVINIASTAGLAGYAYVAAYCAAKHGVIGLTRALALEVAAKGVTVNAVCPGYTDTPLLDRAIDQIQTKTGRSADEARASLARSNPQGRLVTPEEVADTVVWLAGDAAAAINGQAIAVAGGEVM